jgi:hypothetical protein
MLRPAQMLSDDVEDTWTRTSIYQDVADRLANRKLASASASFSNVGIEFNMRITASTSRTRSLGRSNFRLPPSRVRLT